jgi:hypothetical protein
MPYLHRTVHDQSPCTVPNLASWIFHFHGRILAPRIFPLDCYMTVQAPVARIFHLDHYTRDQAFIARVFHSSRSHLAAGIFHIDHPILRHI